MYSQGHADDRSNILCLPIAKNCHQPHRRSIHSDLWNTSLEQSPRGSARTGKGGGEEYSTATSVVADWIEASDRSIPGSIYTCSFSHSLHPVNIILLAALATFFLLLHYTLAKPPAFFQNYIKTRYDDPRKRCQNRPDQQDPCQPKYAPPPYLSITRFSRI